MARSHHLIKINEKLSIRNGIATTIILNISNNYFVLFAITVLGATNYQVGLISSLPQFVGMLAMIVGSLIINSLEEKKKFTSFSFLITRTFLLLMILIVYLPIEYRSWVFVIIVGLMNLPGSFANLSWQSFIGDLIPDERRSGFFSERNKIMTMIGMISTFTVGLLLQQFNQSSALPFQLLFLTAFIFGIVEFRYLMRHKEQKKTVKKEKKKLNFGLHVFKHKPFLYFLICSLFFNFGWQMAWSLFNIYQIKYAGATALWLSLFTVANQIAQIASYNWWGKMAEKHGNAKMLILVSIGMASAPFLTILSTNLVYLVFVNLSSGLFVSGTVLLLFNHLLEVTKDDNRTVCISNYNILLAFIAFIAPQFGVFLLEQTNINIAMTISTIIRASSAILFFFMFMFMKKNRQLSRSSGHI